MFKEVGVKHRIQVFSRDRNTIKNLLVAPRDKDHITKKSGVICRFKCDRWKCDEEHVEESSRTFGERFKEHLNVPSPIYSQCNTTCHTTTVNSFNIVGGKEQNLTITINELIYLRANNPFLNKSIGKYHLSYDGMRLYLTYKN